MNYALDAIWWRLSHPAVRDLAALLTAPPLWHSGCELPIPRLLDNQGFRFLLSLDSQPDPLQQWLEQEAPFGHRLGRYAESLLAFWLAHAPHCQLIARNHPVRSKSGQTLGATDFLCLLNSTPYHLELTCKYYGGTAPDDFQGLNPADTLLGKAAKLQQQCRLFHTPQARVQLPAPLQGYLKTSAASFCEAKTNEASFCEAKTDAAGFPAVETAQTGGVAVAAPERVWLREVMLFGDGVPWVFAQTLLPESGARGTAAGLTELGDEPIGPWLFARRTRRQSLQWRRDEGGLYARRSMLLLEGSPLQISELFLPQFDFAD